MSLPDLLHKIDIVQAHTLLKPGKLRALYTLLNLVENVEGDIAECGVFTGGSLRFIASIMPDVAVHGFDTFQGLPATADQDEAKLYPGRFLCTFDTVRKYVGDMPNITLYQGMFPDTVGPIVDKKFRFVHLDMDLYKCTMDGLSFFYPRLSSGGILLCDDYGAQGIPGIKKAFDDFFEDKVETYLPCGLRQVCFFKL